MHDVRAQASNKLVNLNKVFIRNYPDADQVLFINFQRKSTTSCAACQEDIYAKVERAYVSQRFGTRGFTIYDLQFTN